jgi:hypothetical protein
MMKRAVIYLMFVFFIFISFAEAYALKLDFGAPQEIDEGNLKEAGLSPSEPEVEPIVRPVVEYKSQGLRNPFEQSALILQSSEGEVGLKPEAGKLPQLTIQGVIWGSNIPQAIINNKVVKVGDILEGAEVTEINKEGVIILFAGVSYKLTTTPAMGQQEYLENK